MRDRGSLRSRASVRFRRPSRYARVRFSFWLALLAVTVGVGLQWGLSFGLIVGGALAAAVLLGATDTDEPEQDGARRR